MSNVSQEERKSQWEKNKIHVPRLWVLEGKAKKGVLEGTHDAEKLANILQDFLENKGNEKKELVPLAQVIRILGQRKVITAKQVAKVRSIEVPKDAFVRYSEATLHQCAQENIQGNADWRYVYCSGKSLRELREIHGTDQSKQPHFDKDIDMWLNSKNYWEAKKMEAGYYLINFFGQFEKMTWEQQEAEIVNLGGKYERCHEAIFSEAILTIFMVNNSERIAKNWYHWGVSVASNGCHVYVGDNDDYGYNVRYNWLDSSRLRGLRVALVRKFDF